MNAQNLFVATCTLLGALVCNLGCAENAARKKTTARKETTAHKETTAPQTPPASTSTASTEASASASTKKSGFDDALLRVIWNEATSPTSQCAGPDGPARIACQLATSATVQNLSDLLAVDAYASGPDRSAGNPLKSKTHFGHYDKMFVRRLHRVGVPALFDKVFLQTTQAGYDTHLKAYVRLAHRVMEKMKHNLPWRWDQSRVMQRCMEAGTPVAISYFAGFSRKGFVATSSKQGVHRPCDAPPPIGQGARGESMITAFWIRRWIDGTALEFSGILDDVMALYDPEGLDMQAPDLGAIGD